jgi:hypothetical protein
MVLLNDTRKYLCVDCAATFRARDRRKLIREGDRDTSCTGCRNSAALKDDLLGPAVMICIFRNSRAWPGPLRSALA